MDSRPLVAGAATAQGSMAKLSTSATKGLGGIPIGAAAAGLAIGAFAAKSVRAAIEFDSAFTRIAAISNASAENIQQWRGEVMELSGETARAPAELAEALFFLSSAGLDAGQVMETLEMSAKASAAGLGSTVDIANITASALNAYAEAGLTAAQVTDTLVAAVREGRAEPEEFAGALGKILPIASQAGVTFDQVTASLASLSNIGLDVDEGVTAIRGVLQAIVAPGNLAAKAMASIGLSAQDMLDAISERGLFGALQMLDKAARANTTTQAEYIGVLRQVVPNVRALTGVLGLTGQEAAKVDAIFDNVMDSTGSLGEAFRETAESDAFKLQKAWQDLANAGQEVAADALPGIASGVSMLTSVLGPAIAQADKLLLTFLAYKAVTAWLPALFVRVGKAVQVLAGAQVASAASAVGAAAATSGLIIAHKSEVGSAGAAAAAERTLTESRLASTASATGAKTASVGLATGLGRVAGPIALAIGAGMILNDVFYGTNKTFEEGAETISGVLHRALDAGAIDINAYAAALAAAEAHEFDSDALRGVVEELERRTAGQEELNLATIGYVAAAAPVVAVAEEVGRAQDHGASGARAFAAALEQWAEITGDSMSTVQQAVGKLREDYKKLLEEGQSSVEAWGSVTGTVLQEAAADFASWREEAAGNLNFVASTFGDIASDFKGSATEIASALRTSLGEQRRFAADLATILEDDTVGAKLLVEQLLEMGPAGADAARTIASASDDTRASIERSLSLGQSMAETTASKLQEVLVGTLKDIRNILEEIAIHWGIDLDANDGGAKTKLTALETRLLRLERDPYVAEVDAVTAAALADVSNLYGALHALEVHNWKATVIVETVGGSTGFHLLEMLRDELDTFEGVQANAQVHVAVVDDSGLRGVQNIVSRLGELTAAIGAAVQEGMSKARLLQAKELEAMASDVADQIEKLQARMRSFRDDIRSGFGQFDILGGAAGLGDVLKEQRIAALEAQIQAAQSLAAPDQVLIDALNVQLEQLRDALIVPTAAEFGAFLQDELARARSFAAGLKALQGAGLDKNLLADLASRGPEALPFIQALLAGGESLIADFNETQGTINDIAGRSMDRLVNEEFGAAIQRASERLDSLRDTIRDFVQSFDRAELPDKFEDLGKALDSMLAALDGPPGGGGNAGQGGGNGGGAAGDGGNGSSSGAQYHFHGGTFIGTTVRELAQAIDQELLQKAKRDGQAAHHGT